MSSATALTLDKLAARQARDLASHPGWLAGNYWVCRTCHRPGLAVEPESAEPRRCPRCGSPHLTFVPKP